MDGEIERKVRERAYAIWEQEGRPHGKDREHWERAHRAVTAELAKADAEAQKAAPQVALVTSAPSSAKGLL
jgi:hypothetical protein